MTITAGSPANRNVTAVKSVIDLHPVFALISSLSADRNQIADNEIKDRERTIYDRERINLLSFSSGVRRHMSSY